MIDCDESSSAWPLDSLRLRDWNANRTRFVGLRRRSFLARRWRGFIIIVSGLHADVEHHVMNERFQFLGLGGEVQLSHLTPIATAPATNFSLHMVKQLVNAVARALNGRMIAFMVLAVDVLGGLQQLVRFAIRLGVTGVVLVVVVQVETELVGHRLQPFGELFVVLEAAELECDGALRGSDRHDVLNELLRLLWDELRLLHDNRRCVVVNVRVVVERAVMPMRRYDVPIVVVMIGDVGTVRINQMKPAAMSGDAAVMVVLRQTDLRDSRQPADGQCCRQTKSQMPHDSTFL